MAERYNPLMEILRPCLNYVCIQPSAAPTATASGLIIPGTAQQDQCRRGTVVAVGPGRMSEHGYLLPMGVKKGDVVLFSVGPKGWPAVSLNGEQYIMIRDIDIHGVVISTESV